MKPTFKFRSAITATIGIGLLFSATAQAAKGHATGSATAPSASAKVTGRAAPGSFSGYPGGVRGSGGGYYAGGYKNSGNYYGGNYGGYYGGNGRYYGGGYCYPRYNYSNCNNWWYPWAFSFSYVSTPSVYYTPAPVYYSTPVVYSTPTVVYSSPTTVPASTSSTPAPSAPPAEQPKPMAPSDVVALVKAGIGDDLIISQIRNSRTVYHLTAAEIIDLKNNGVSEKVLDFMINTATPPPQGK